MRAVDGRASHTSPFVANLLVRRDLYEAFHRGADRVVLMPTRGELSRLKKLPG